MDLYKIFINHISDKKLIQSIYFKYIRNSYILIATTKPNLNMGRGPEHTFVSKEDIQMAN